MIQEEIRTHLEQKILPFWTGMKDDVYGGFYGGMDNNLILNRAADSRPVFPVRGLLKFPGGKELRR